MNSLSDSAGHVVVYVLGESEDRHTHRLAALARDATPEDIRRAIGASLGIEPDAIRLVVVASDPEGGVLPTTGPIRLHTDLPEAQWLRLAPAELGRLIKLLVDRRYRAAKRGDTAMARMMDERLDRARALRDGR